MSNKRRCAECKLYFPAADLLVSQGVSVFCSEECVRKKQEAAAYRARKKTTGKVPGSVRKAVERRDAGVCELCRQDSKYQPKGWLQLHHIKYRSEGGGHAADNLISLCNDCHAIAHSKKKLFQPYFIKLLKKETTDADMESGKI